MIEHLCQPAGAILAQDSDIRITGNATVAYNEASRDGGEKYS